MKNPVDRPIFGTGHFVAMGIETPWKQSFIKGLALWFAMLCLGCSHTKKPLLSEAYPIIPTPQEIEYGQQEISFKTFFLAANEFEKEGLVLQEFLEDNSIGIHQDGLPIILKKQDLPAIPNDEGYKLKIDSAVTLTNDGVSKVNDLKFSTTLSTNQSF